MYFPFDQDWNDLEGGHYLSRTRINTAGPNAATIQISPWTIIEVKPGALGQILHTVSGQLNRSIFHLSKIVMSWEGAIIRVRLE